MKKTIYSLPPLAETLRAVHQRYLKFISDIETPDGGADNLHHLAETEIVDNRRYKGFNLLSEEDSSLFRILASGEFTIKGFSNRTLRQRLPTLNAGQVTRLLKRLHVHGIIKQISKHYRYYLADLGRQAAILALKIARTHCHSRSGRSTIQNFLVNLQALHWLGTKCERSNIGR